MPSKCGVCQARADVPGVGGCAGCGRGCQEWVRVCQACAGVRRRVRVCAGVCGCARVRGGRGYAREWAWVGAWAGVGRTWMCACTGVGVRGLGCRCARAWMCACAGVGVRVHGRGARPAESSSGSDAPSPTTYFPGEVARPAESSSGGDAPSPTKYFMGRWHVLQKVVPGLTLHPRQSISSGRWHVLQKVVPGLTPRPRKVFPRGGGTSCKK